MSRRTALLWRIMEILEEYQAAELAAVLLWLRERRGK
jgi:hypothetical protein